MRRAPIKFRDPSGHMELNEDHAYQEGVSDSYYCQISPDAPYCQTDWEEVGWAAVGFVAWAAGPSLVKGGIEVVRTVGVRVVGGRILKATAEELAESAMTGRDPDPINIGLDAATEILDDARVLAQSSNQPAYGSSRPKKFWDRHGNYTDGQYTVDAVGLAKHTTGSLAGGKSQFLYGVNAPDLVLDAAHYADANGLWVQKGAASTARVFVQNGPIGVVGHTGELTSWVSVTRTKTGFVHGWPASAPQVEY